jgi:hypothetical protein
VLEDSGHFGHAEEPDAFARAVVGFVASTGAYRRVTKKPEGRGGPFRLRHVS